MYNMSAIAFSDQIMVAKYNMIMGFMTGNIQGLFKVTRTKDNAVCVTYCDGNNNMIEIASENITWIDDTHISTIKPVRFMGKSLSIVNNVVTIA